MQLPIYRRLDERLKILGLSLIELATVGAAYVVLTEILSFWAYGPIFSLVISVIAVALLLYLHRKHESHFISKWLRFASLPEGLARRTMTFKQQRKKDEVPL